SGFVCSLRQLRSMSTASLVCLLFSYCDVNPRDLPSFPTRRSSDLVPPAAPCRQQARSGISARRPPPAEGRSAESAHRFPPPRPADRKSTRLNSSHVKISYAVFCLKKKNKEETKTTGARSTHENSRH